MHKVQPVTLPKHRLKSVTTTPKTLNNIKKMSEPDKKQLASGGRPSKALPGSSSAKTKNKPSVGNTAANIGGPVGHKPANTKLVPLKSNKKDEVKVIKAEDVMEEIDEDEDSYQVEAKAKAEAHGHTSKLDANELDEEWEDQSDDEDIGKGK